MQELPRRGRFILIVVFVIMTACVVVGIQSVTQPATLQWLRSSFAKLQQHNPGTYAVTAFHDGDTVTISMDGTEETIRLIGVDTPETHDPRKSVQCFGVAASEFTRQLIGNKRVRLEADPLNSNRDRYNRLLRYVYLPDGTFVNKTIIESGYGFAYLDFPFTKAEEFETAQRDARLQNKGLWNECQIGGTETRPQTNDAR